MTAATRIADSAPTRSISSPPAADEFEVSLFGPGVGECVVAHLGDGEWIVVDSCKVPNGNAVALEYLRAISVDPSAIKMVFVTHWHDDHIKGIASVFEAATSSQIVMPEALHSSDFFELLAAAEHRDSLNDPSGLDEMSKLMQIIQRRLPPGATKSNATPQWAVQGMQWADGGALAPKPRWRIVALSPSHVAIKNGHQRFGELIASYRAGDLSKRVVAIPPNSTALVLWVIAGDCNILLGSDLETTTSPLDGWGAVTTAHTNGPKAVVVKVPHHGSDTADHPPAWSSMLVDSPHAIVTPFRRQKLPRRADLQRLQTRTADLYVTANPDERGLPKRDKAVERQIAEAARDRTVEVGRMGHIRLRGPLSGGAVVTTELFNKAYKVTT